MFAPHCGVPDPHKGVPHKRSQGVASAARAVSGAAPSDAPRTHESHCESHMDRTAAALTWRTNIPGLEEPTKPSASPTCTSPLESCDMALILMDPQCPHPLLEISAVIDPLPMLALTHEGGNFHLLSWTRRDEPGFHAHPGTH